MKRIFTFSTIALFIALFFTSCIKEQIFNESYWLSKERGEVVYSSSSCTYYIVETNNGYTVIRAISSRPYEGDILYGDFSHYGVKDIYNRTDDSVMMFTGSKGRLIRRSRGFAPSPVNLTFNVDGIFAAGAELVNCFCLGKDRKAIMSQHIGDLKNLETLEFYTESLNRFREWNRRGSLQL